MEVRREMRELRTFRKNSKLYKFLIRKNGSLISKNSRRYRSSTIYLALEQVIRKENLFDCRNPEIVICGEELEKILDVRSFYRGQLHKFVEAHLTEDRPDSLASSRSCRADMNKIIEARNVPRGLRLEPSREGFDIQGSYLVEPNFFKVLQAAGLTETVTTAIPYRRICQLTADYICSRKHEFFDLRNILIAHVKGDLLAEAFKVDHFSRPQITALIRSKIRPVRRSKRLRNVF